MRNSLVATLFSLIIGLAASAQVPPTNRFDSVLAPHGWKNTPCVVKTSLQGSSFRATCTQTQGTRQVVLNDWAVKIPDGQNNDLVFDVDERVSGTGLHGLGVGIVDLDPRNQRERFWPATAHKWNLELTVKRLSLNLANDRLDAVYQLSFTGVPHKIDLRVSFLPRGNSLGIIVYQTGKHFREHYNIFHFAPGQYIGLKNPIARVIPFDENAPLTQTGATTVDTAFLSLVSDVTQSGANVAAALAGPQFTNGAGQHFKQHVYGRTADKKRPPVYEEMYFTVTHTSRQADAVTPHFRVNQKNSRNVTQRERETMYFDSWMGTNFSNFGDFIDKVHDTVGIFDAKINFQVWERGGYDCPQPDVIPANPALGGTQELRKAIAKTQGRPGIEVLLRTNPTYIDEGAGNSLFSFSKVAKRQDGSYREEGRACSGRRFVRKTGHASFLADFKRITSYAQSVGAHGINIDVTTSKPVAETIEQGTMETFRDVHANMWGLFDHVNQTFGQLSGEQAMQGGYQWVDRGIENNEAHTLFSSAVHTDGKNIAMVPHAMILKGENMVRLPSYAGVWNGGGPLLEKPDEWKPWYRYYAQSLAFSLGAYAECCIWVPRDWEHFNLYYMQATGLMMGPYAERFRDGGRLKEVWYQVGKSGGKDVFKTLTELFVARGPIPRRLKIEYTNGLEVWVNDDPSGVWNANIDASITLALGPTGTAVRRITNDTVLLQYTSDKLKFSRWKSPTQNRLYVDSDDWIKAGTVFDPVRRQRYNIVWKGKGKFTQRGTQLHLALETRSGSAPKVEFGFLVGVILE